MPPLDPRPTTRRLLYAGGLWLTVAGAAHGQPPTLESVFMTFTGRSLDEDVEEDDDND